jgi:hypothetical protein
LITYVNVESADNYVSYALLPALEQMEEREGSGKRRLIYTEKEIRLWQRRQYESSHEFKDKYRYRSGIEATNARFIHMTGARRVA